MCGLSLLNVQNGLRERMPFRWGAFRCKWIRVRHFVSTCRAKGVLADVWVWLFGFVTYWVSVACVFPKGWGLAAGLVLVLAGSVKNSSIFATHERWRGCSNAMIGLIGLIGRIGRIGLIGRIGWIGLIPIGLPKYPLTQNARNPRISSFA
jgi:hypothetical protein